MTDNLFWLLLILRYMHILGAITLMGGAIFMRFALRPVVIGLAPETKAAVHEQVRSRWAKIVMLATLLLLVSGLANLILAGQYNFDPIFGKEKGYHMVVGIKFLLALPIFFIAATLAGRSSLAKRLQANAEWWMNLNLTLALLMVLIGGVLKFVNRKPKGQAPAPAAVTMLLDHNASQGQNASQKLPFLAVGE
jgi:hypothetical protein